MAKTSMIVQGHNVLVLDVSTWVVLASVGKVQLCYKKGVDFY